MARNSTKLPLPIGSFLNSETGVLGNLIQQIELLKILNQNLTSFLDSPLNAHCTVANYANDIMVLHTDSPVWASRLRYILPQLLNFMQDQCGLVSIKTIRIKVMPPQG